MTINELQILLDLNQGNEIDVLEEHAKECFYGYFFINSDDGHCYLFNKTGKLNDIRKIKTLTEDCIDTNIRKIIIPDSVTSIGGGAFYKCRGLTNVTIGNSVMSIDAWAFYGCSKLTSVIIPDGVTSIGASTFSCCNELTSIVIPDSVTRIGASAFFDCTSLTSIIFKGKTIDELKVMKYYPWGIEDESIIKAELS